MAPANPFLIRDIPKTRNEPAPLFLIHDASGLATSYFKLGCVGRKVYGISDPKFDHDGIGGWQSVNEIAEAYLRLIRRVTLRGDIVLGGWSFGGIIAIQIAHLLAKQGRGLRVSRIILIDSVYPRCQRPEARKGPPHRRHAPMLPGLNEDTLEKLLTALMRATCISDQWDPPLWAQRHVDVQCGNRLSIPPPVVLIRADGMVPTKDPKEMCPLDRTRFLPQLGWEDMQNDFISHVLHLPGNHYNLFDEEHAHMTTASLRKALDIAL